jgi:hypothetical protein
MDKKLAPGQSLVGDALTSVIDDTGTAYQTLGRLWERVRSGEPGAEEAYDRWLCGAEELKIVNEVTSRLRLAANDMT